MTRTPIKIEVYWDESDTGNPWTYRAYDNNGLIDEGDLRHIDDDDLDAAIEEACYFLDMDLRADDFGRLPNVDGGFAVWCNVADD